MYKGYLSWDEHYDFKQNIITIATTFGCIIFSHLLMFYLSKIKVDYYRELDGRINESKEKQELKKEIGAQLLEEDTK